MPVHNEQAFFYAIILGRELNIVFMGTPDFAVPSLKILLDNGFNIVGVITSPDKPSGRGRKIQYSAVKTFALQAGLNVLQPANLKDPEFIEELRSLKPDLQVVVAFRMLPEVVWAMSPMGTFNLHASLLPQYRGAAPINWAIINGETKTGATTFLLDKEIDTGKILQQESVEIGQSDNAGDLHDILMTIGSQLVLKTAIAIMNGQISPQDQTRLISKETSLRKAPKILKEDCGIDWARPVSDVHNFIRGLSPYPGAHSRLKSADGIIHIVKIYKTSLHQLLSIGKPGEIITNSKDFLHVNTSDGLFAIEEIQVAGKQRMTISDFLRGFQVNDEWVFMSK